MTAEGRAIASMLDVVEELAQGLANGQTPEPAWANVVSDVFAEHRKELVLLGENADASLYRRTGTEDET